MGNWKEFSIIPITLLLLALLLWVAKQETPSTAAPVPVPPPDFDSIRDVKEKKDQFFSYMLPFVRHANQEIIGERVELLRIVEKMNNQQPLTDQEQATIEKLALKYRVSKLDPFSHEALTLLKRRVDTIPASLALAQAANESAWGTARFAKAGNNYFGLWCWSRKCGLVPKKRDEGARHEVAQFESPADSVKYYMLTLNSHPAYKDLRVLRSETRASNESLTGMFLANGLLSYSERRDAYVEEVQAMIRINELRKFNRPHTDTAQ